MSVETLCVRLNREHCYYRGFVRLFSGARIPTIDMQPLWLLAGAIDCPPNRPAPSITGDESVRGMADRNALANWLGGWPRVQSIAMLAELRNELQSMVAVAVREVMSWPSERLLGEAGLWRDKARAATTGAPPEPPATMADFAAFVTYLRLLESWVAERIAELATGIIGAAPSMAAVSEVELELTKPLGPAQFAKIFGHSPDTFKRLFDAGKIRGKKLSSKQYQIAIVELPAKEQNKHRSERSDQTK